MLGDFRAHRGAVASLDVVHQLEMACDIHSAHPAFVAAEHDGHADGTLKLLPRMQQGVILGQPAQGAVEFEICFDPILDSIATRGSATGSSKVIVRNFLLSLSQKVIVTNFAVITFNSVAREA